LGRDLGIVYNKKHKRELTMLIYEPFVHIKPRGKPYDLPSLPINQKRIKP
ncbi:hypothetical protein AAUPMC_21361, partial [Pasteurella multocida subsp. multocida str. Anand1_cattle]